MNKKNVWGALFILTLLLIACQGRQPIEPEPIELSPVTPIAALPTEDLLVEPSVAATAVATNEATAVPPAVQPTAEVSSPTSAPVGVEGPTRINFEAGGTSAVINSRLNGPGHDEYVLRAMAGQLMTVNIDSPNNDVRLTLYGLDDGQPLSRADTGATYWRDTLLATQDYSISAVYNGPGSDYTLSVVVDPIPVDSGPLNSVIQFAPGADSATVTGIIGAAFTPDTYRLRASAGQTMYVSVETLTSQTQPTVTVLSARGLVSPDGVFRNQQQWAGQLPYNDEYQIVVNANQANVDYVLNVQVIYTQPGVIQFAPGATSGFVDGRLGANEVMVYALEAVAGQKMHVRLESHMGNAKLFVETTDRSAYLGFDLLNEQTEWKGILPQSGPYYLFVTSRYPQTFRLQVEILTPSNPVADARCPTPTGQQRLFSDPVRNYCFLYPAGLRALAADQGTGSGMTGTAVWGPPLDQGPEPLAVGLNIMPSEAANGRSALQVATDYVNQNGGEIGQEIMIGGETAVVVNSVPGLFPIRGVFLVHNDFLYQFQFAPEGIPTPVTLPGLDALYADVISSFTFLD